MKKFILYPNPKRNLDSEITSQIENILDESGYEYIVCRSENELSDKITDSEMVITLGGDGTLLHAARIAAPHKVPLLGVNLGRKGFMVQLESYETDRIKPVLDGDYTLDRRMMLDVSLIRDGNVHSRDYALNEVIIAGIARSVHLAVSCDGNKITEFSGDGVIVSTPTGSTAYSLSAGGPIVEPGTENIIITPICPHVLGAKSYVLSSNRVITVHPDMIEDKVAYMSTDGSGYCQLNPGDIIEVKQSALVTGLVKVSDENFYDRISRKLGEK